MLQMDQQFEPSPLSGLEFRRDLHLVKEEDPIKEDVQTYSEKQSAAGFVLTEQGCKFQHMGFTYYSCPICREVFLLFSDLTAHSQTHSTDIMKLIPKHSGKENNRFIEMVGIVQRNENPQWATNVELTEKAGLFKDGGNIYYSDVKTQTNVEVALDKKYKCPICQQGFDIYQQFRQHKSNHTTGWPFKCVLCKKGFEFKNQLNQHVKIHKAHKHKCNLCNYATTDPSRLQDHKQDVHNIKRSTEVVCELCGKEVPSVRHLNYHMYSTHSERTNKCSDCDKMFVNKASLRAHEECHNPNRVKKYMCEICGKSFYTGGHLKTHRIQSHAERKGKLHKCEFCGKTVTASSSLAVHRRQHTGEKPFSCDVCNKTFSANKNLTVHKRIHTGVKPFKCELCGKAFTQKPSLIIHIRYHTGLKPFECKICPKSFVTKTHLTAHIKTHPCS